MKAYYANQASQTNTTMINDLQAAVYEFNKIGGQYCAEEMGLPDTLDKELAIVRQLSFVREEIYETDDALTLKDFNEAVDGAGDILYVALHLFNQLGVDANVVLREIQRSNMSKFVDGEAIMKDGKIQKGPDYFKPDWEAVLPEAAENYRRFVESRKTGYIEHGNAFDPSCGK